MRGQLRDQSVLQDLVWKCACPHHVSMTGAVTFRDKLDKGRAEAMLTRLSLAWKADSLHLARKKRVSDWSMLVP